MNRVLNLKKPQTPEYKRILRRIKEKKMNMKPKTPKTDERGDIDIKGGHIGAEIDACILNSDAKSEKVLTEISSQSDKKVKEVKGGPLLTLSSNKEIKNSKSQKLRRNKARIVDDPTQPKLTRFWGPKNDGGAT